MTLEQKKSFAMHVAGSPGHREEFINWINDKVNELNDITTFKKSDHEKDLSVEVIYAGRINAAIALEEFKDAILRLAVVEDFSKDSNEDDKGDI